MEPKKPECTKCGVKNKICLSPEGQGPAFCPTLHRKESIARANEEYTKPDILKFAHEASVQEAECYINRGVKPYVLHPSKPRVQETCEFAHKMGYRRLGVAFCAGLHICAHAEKRIWKVAHLFFSHSLMPAGRQGRLGEI